MKFILLALFIFTVESYAQNCTNEDSDSHLLGTTVKNQFEKCIEWQNPDPQTTPDGAQLPSKCVKFVTCVLQFPGQNELITIGCECHIRYSTKHPEYNVNYAFPYWPSDGTACTYDKAEEEAREDCTSEFDLENKNSEHWVTNINCKRQYEYICEDGQTLTR